MRRPARAVVPVVALALLFGAVACKRASSIPVVRPGPRGLQLIDLWPRASIVAVGTLAGAHQAGPSQIASYNNESATVYPCEAEFRSSAVIKGNIALENPRLLWFSLFPTCGFGVTPKQLIRSVEQVWFLRSEGPWLRPVIDPSAEFVELFRAFQPVAEDSGDLRRSLSRTLLTPQSVAETDRRFIERFDNFFEMSCDLSGELWCFRVLGDLQKRASPAIRGEICRFLAATYKQCRFSDCPQDPLYPGTEAVEDEQLQAARHASELREASEERINKALNSGNPSDGESILRRLQILSCNIDALVRKRAREATRRFFPKAAIPTCLSCP